MAAKSDGGSAAAVCVEEDNPPRSLCGSAGRSSRAGGKPYSLLDCCWVLCALLVFFSDGATDLWLAADYCLRGDYWWFGLTLVFVVVPSAVVQVLSFRWFVYDYSDFSRSAVDGTAVGGGGSAAVAGATGDAAAGGDGSFSTKGSAAAPVVTPMCASSSAPPTAAAGTGGGSRRSCIICMWVFQIVLHVMQLGQVWR